MEQGAACSLLRPPWARPPFRFPWGGRPPPPGAPRRAAHAAASLCLCAATCLSADGVTLAVGAPSTTPTAAPCGLPRTRPAGQRVTASPHCS